MDRRGRGAAATTQTPSLPAANLPFKADPLFEFAAPKFSDFSEEQDVFDAWFTVNHPELEPSAPRVPYAPLVNLEELYGEQAPADTAQRSATATAAAQVDCSRIVDVVSAKRAKVTSYGDMLVNDEIQQMLATHNGAVKASRA